MTLCLIFTFISTFAPLIRSFLESLGIQYRANKQAHNDIENELSIYDGPQMHMKNVLEKCSYIRDINTTIEDQ